MSFRGWTDTRGIGRLGSASFSESLGASWVIAVKLHLPLTRAPRRHTLTAIYSKDKKTASIYHRFVVGSGNNVVSLRLLDVRYGMEQMNKHSHNLEPGFSLWKKGRIKFGLAEGEEEPVALTLHWRYQDECMI